MAHPTRTGDLVVFSYPPYQFDAATPGTLIARSAFFGQHGYVPDVQDLAANINMRATFLAGGPGIAKGSRRRDAHDRHRAHDRLPPRGARAAAEPGRRAARPGDGRLVADAGSADRPQRLPRTARADHHADRRPATSRSVEPHSWPRCSTRRPPRSPDGSLLFAAGDNVGASPANSGLLEDMPAIDVENAWGLDATSYGNHEFDYGIERLQAHQARADFPFLGRQHRRHGDHGEPGLGGGHARLPVRRRPGRRDRHRARDHARAGQRRGHRRASRSCPRSRRSRRSPRSSGGEGVKVQVVLIHEGTAVGTNTIDGVPGGAVGRPDRDDRRGHPGQHGRRHPGRSHAPGVEPDGRRHPRRRRDERRGELLGRADGRERLGRRVGGRRDPHRQEPRRRQARRTSRRSSTTPTPRPPCCATR